MSIAAVKANDPAIGTVGPGPNADATNHDGIPPAVQPRTSPGANGPPFGCEAPANSLTVTRLNTRQK